MSTTTDAPATAEIQHDVGQPDGAIAPIVFPQGLPGFPGATSFALRPLTDAAGELLVLESTEDPELRFLVLPYADRQVPLLRTDVDGACALLGIRPDDAAVLLVVTSRHEPGSDGLTRQRLYVNLRAPLMLDTVRRTAVQHVLASPAYSVRHCLAAAA